MPDPVYVEYLGFYGKGPSARAAREDAEQKAERALGGSYHPSLLVYRNRMAVVFRTPGGWCYEAIHQDAGAPLSSAGPFGSHEQAEAAARSVLSKKSTNDTLRASALTS